MSVNESTNPGAGGGSVSPVQLTTHERARLVSLVDRWLEFGGAWYVDEYLVPIVEEILACRFTDEREGGESTPDSLSRFPEVFPEPPESGL